MKSETMLYEITEELSLVYVNQQDRASFFFQYYFCIITVGVYRTSKF